MYYKSAGVSLTIVRYAIYLGFNNKTALIDFSFLPRNNKTLYTRFGEWVLPLAGLVLVGFAGNSGWKRITSRRKP